MVAAYAAAPLSNPDLVPGITLHIFVDQQIADADADLDLEPYTAEFPIMDKYFHKPREHGFHYGLFALQAQHRQFERLREDSRQLLRRHLACDGGPTWARPAR